MLDLKRIREQLRMTQQELAALIGIHHTSYSQVERGTRDITWEIVCRLAEGVDLETEDLLYEAELRKKLPLKTPANDWWIPRVRLAVRGLSEEQVRTAISVAEAAALGIRQRGNKDKGNKEVKVTK